MSDDTTAAPRRVQLCRTAGWRMPPNTVKVDRTSRWGNPWRVMKARRGLWGIAVPGWDAPSISRDTACEARNFAVEAFRDMCHCGRFDLSRAHELKGRNLACWCPLDQPCHADVLLEIANAE